MGRKRHKKRDEDPGYRFKQRERERTRKNHEHNAGMIDLDNERMKTQTNRLLARLEDLAAASNDEAEKAEKRGHEKGYEEGYVAGYADGEKSAKSKRDSELEEMYAKQAKTAYERGRKVGVEETIEAMHAICKPLLTMFDRRDPQDIIAEAKKTA